MAEVDEYVDEIVRRVEWAAPIQAPPCAAGRAGDGDADGDGDGGASGAGGKRPADGNAMTGAAARFVAAQNLLLSWHRGKVPVGWNRPRTLADFGGGPGGGGKGGVAPPGAVEAARARIATLQRDYATARTEALSALVAGKRSAAAAGGGSVAAAASAGGASAGAGGGAAVDTSSGRRRGTGGSAAAATAAATALRTAPSSATAAATAASRSSGGSASSGRGAAATAAASGDGGGGTIASEDVRALRQLYDAFNADVSALTAAADKIAMTIADIALRTKALQDSI